MPNFGVIILAAGLGKRMHSPLPKVLHEIGGKSLIFHILKRIEEVAPGCSIAVVVGHGRELVESSVREEFPNLNITFVHQTEQKGTGHAARCAMDSEWGQAQVRAKSPVLVLPGDLPLIPSAMIDQLFQPFGRGGVLRVLTTILPDPTGYGRIVRRGTQGPVLRIVEERDANLREKAICEVGTSIYLFHSPFLQAGLHRISNKNAQGEYYLTDLVSQAARAKKKIDVLQWGNPEDLRGVNDLWELSQAGAILNQRTLKHWARQGVRFTDLANTWVDVSVELAPEVTVGSGTNLQGKTRVARRASLGPGVVLKNVQVGEGANVKTGTTAEDSVIGAGASLGPYANLRPESEVGPKAKIGNFVELKKARVGAGTSIAHLSYVGDAIVGERVNIGCGFVTCNFDGRVIDGQRKHQTIIEDDVFLGSDCQSVAPVRIGKGAYVASGSTITEDVEPEALAIARSRQVNKPGYAKKLKAGQKDSK
jgi:bifunctional UDP-N-acetylglucosamine pyrophosphorylase/glucosamine-1-phosphate N-acetyltransferase